MSLKLMFLALKKIGATFLCETFPNNVSHHKLVAVCETHQETSLHLTFFLFFSQKSLELGDSVFG